MNKKKLAKIRGELSACRKRGGIKPDELERLAKELGRSRFKRGKEPTWISETFPYLRPLSIPHHGMSDLNRFTAQTIIDQLESDVECWEEHLESGDGD